MNLHVEVRPIVQRGFKRRFPEIDPPLAVLQALQGVGYLESRYARGWKSEAGKKSRNVGCVQHSRPPCDPVRSFQYVDTHPNADGTSTPYHICFKNYETDEDAWDDVARIMYRQIRVGNELRRPALEAAMNGDLYGVSAGMRLQGYYEGFGKTQADRIANHHRALSGSVHSQAKALGEPMPGFVVPPPVEFDDDFLPDNPLILRGSRGPYVKEWQQILNEYFPDDQVVLVTDGAFGKVTEAATRVWQRAHQLKDDGKVGRLTWEAAAQAAA